MFETSLSFNPDLLNSPFVSTSVLSRVRSGRNGYGCGDVMCVRVVRSNGVVLWEVVHHSVDQSWSRNKLNLRRSPTDLSPIEIAQSVRHSARGLCLANLHRRTEPEQPPQQLANSLFNSIVQVQLLSICLCRVLSYNSSSISSSIED